ncbi:MAG TPA: sigma-70 family RNA polymerase sigma factor [Flavitalea sp.]|nr:sigma-70 family RNA polymerase sigma factor [Flavitalea sp.]
MSTKTLQDAELVAGLRQHAGRKSVENALYLQFRYFIEEGVRKFSVTQEESFSCYSDAIIQTIDTIQAGRFEGRSSLKTYIYQIFHNKCVDQIRKNTTHKSEVHRSAIQPDMLEVLTDPAKTVIQKLVEKADIDDLKRRLGELGDNCKRMLLLSSEGNSDKQIAELMNFKSSDVAKTSRLRCLEKLRKLYRLKT